MHCLSIKRTLNFRGCKTITIAKIDKTKQANNSDFSMELTDRRISKL